jgi:phosphoglycerate dehydrogenase-like enzyme
LNDDRLILLDPHPRKIDVIFAEHDKRRLEALGRVLWHDEGRAADFQIDAHLPRAFALIGQTDLPAERLERAPNLRAICNVEGNFQPNIDYGYCHRHDIAVLSCAPAFAPAVAELALGMALALARGIVENDAAFRRGQELYSAASNGCCHLLRGRRMGLMGCGNVGRNLLPLLRPFSGEILIHDPWVHPHVIGELGGRSVSLEQLLEESDVLFVLAAATAQNAHAIGAAELAKMPQGASVILCSRADLVDFDALLDAADGGRVRVAIDVFPEEPVPAGARVRHVRNVILSGHRAGGLPETYREIGRMVVDDLELISRGLPSQRMQRAQHQTAARYRSKPVALVGNH